MVRYTFKMDYINLIILFLKLIKECCIIHNGLLKNPYKYD